MWQICACLCKWQIHTRTSRAVGPITLLGTIIGGTGSALLSQMERALVLLGRPDQWLGCQRAFWISTPSAVGRWLLIKSGRCHQELALVTAGSQEGIGDPGSSGSDALVTVLLPQPHSQAGFFWGR